MERVSISSKRGFHSLRRSQNASKEQTSCDLFGAGPPVAFLSFQLFLCALAQPPDPSNSSVTVMQHHLRASTGGILQGSRWQTQNPSSCSLFIGDRRAWSELLPRSSKKRHFKFEGIPRNRKNRDPSSVERRVDPSSCVCSKVLELHLGLRLVCRLRSTPPLREFPIPACFRSFFTTLPWPTWLKHVLLPTSF